VIERAEGAVFDIQDLAVTDGAGLRTVVFLKGCPLRCRWCANPEGQERGREVMHIRSTCARCMTCAAFCPSGAVSAASDGGPVFAREACSRCADTPCVARCPTRSLRTVGREWTADALYARVRQNAIFYRNSGGGVTLSGGEPLAQPMFVREFLARCAAVGLSVGVETCGFFDWESVEPFIRNIAFFFFDVKCLDDAVHRRVTGQGNERILGNLERLAALCADRITISVPVVGGVNASADFFEALADLCRRLGIRSVRLLPYHTLGVSKYKGLGRSYLMPDSAAVEPEEIGRFAELLRASGIECRID